MLSGVVVCVLMCLSGICFHVVISMFEELCVKMPDCFVFLCLCFAVLDGGVEKWCFFGSKFHLLFLMVACLSFFISSFSHVVFWH